MSARIRTGYSFRQAVGRINDVIARIQVMGLTHAPITDTASTFGFTKWRDSCSRVGIPPVYGVELAVTPSIHEKKPSFDFWTFIAKDSLVPINELVSIATQQFRYQPLLTIEQATERDDVWIIMGHRSQTESITPKQNLFFGVGPALTKGQFNRAMKSGHRPVAVSDNRYTSEGEQGFYETVCGRGSSTQSYSQWIMSDDEWSRACSYAPAEALDRALKTRQHIFEFSTADIASAEMIHPDRPASLAQMCADGAEALGCDLARPEYAARLKRELDLIAEKGFEDYFYLVADICAWARERMIVGPGRGSSCGSLVCYLLKITTVDPIKYDLLFERFIDINRDDIPDIDIDFPEHRRAEVFDYISEKFGHERVARLGTVAMYQPRSALNETAKAMEVAPWLVTPVVDSLVEYAAGDARAGHVIEDTLASTEAGQAFIAAHPEMIISAKMEGHPRHAGQHAAGIVITEQPVRNYVAVDQRTGATMCDKRDAEVLNLLKIDALGLTQLSIFEHALKLAKLPRDHLFKIPLDDAAAFNVLKDRKFSGIFQFNGAALQGITAKVEVSSLDDIVAITALARPGPLGGGGTQKWIDVRTGRDTEKYPHPSFEPILKSTRGVIAYQEQVMRIVREIGGMSWEDVTALRKAMSKSMGAEKMQTFRDKWQAGAAAHGLTEFVTNQVWSEMVSYGAYAFNLSHALAYGMVSYWCCWLKAHYPLEFAAATLSYTDNPEVQIKLLRELAAEGVDYLPADADLSEIKWTVKRDGGWNHLVGPLSNVIGVGPKMMSSIVSARARNEPLSDRAKKLLDNPKTKIDSLYPVSDAVKRIMPDPKQHNIISTPTPIADVQTNGEKQEVMVFCVLENIRPKDENSQEMIKKRDGRVLTGPTQSLNLRLSDDTDTVFAKINRYDFERIGQPIVDRGRVNKALYAVKGEIPSDFRMISVKQVKYIGDLDAD
jgi:DNA polymerase-3 subunit alpha